MAATADYSTVTARIDSYYGSLFTRDNRKHAIINLSVCGFYFLPSDDPSCEDRSCCHICSIQLENWTDSETSNNAYLCALHTEECVYYRPKNFLSMVNEDSDFRELLSDKRK
jgi:hypothetical protein